MGGEVVILANSLISHFQWGLRHSGRGFDYGNWYFQNDNGQTLFLDGILMDIMHTIPVLEISLPAYKTTGTYLSYLWYI